MKLGLYFDLRNPPGWRQDWKRLYDFTLEVCEEADHLGARSLWFSEHHLFDDGYLNQPLTFAAAVAARTRTARIGTAVLLAPLRAAVQIAEEATVVDLISGGRLDLGLGTGYRQPEFDLFEKSLVGRYDRTDQTARDLRALWKSGQMLPPPVQSELPIWMGYQGPKGAYRAGALGEGLLSVNSQLLEPYQQGLIAGGHDPQSARMAGALSAFTTDDPERDWPVVAKHLAWQADSYRSGMTDGTDHAAPRPVDPERIRQRGLTSGFHGLLVDRPEVVAARIRDATKDLPVEAVYFWVSIAGMPEDMVVRHAQTICNDLAPLLTDA